MQRGPGVELLGLDYRTKLRPKVSEVCLLVLYGQLAKYSRVV